MKNYSFKLAFSFTLIVALFALANSAFASTAIGARNGQSFETHLIRPDNVFIPSQFDDNDNAQIAISGKLPDTCHEFHVAYSAVDREKKKIFLKIEDRFYSNAYCMQVLVPYSEVLSVGPLGNGSYEVIAITDAGSEAVGMLNVSQAKSVQKDNFLYAPISSVDFSQSFAGPVISLEGILAYSCYQITEVKTNLQNHVIEIQPIVEAIDKKCKPETTAFKKLLYIKNLTRGSYLIHVRSANGLAVNKMIEIY